MAAFKRLMLPCKSGARLCGEMSVDQRVHSLDGRARRSGGGREPSKYDVSIILNLHNEARYLKRTMLSLEEAVRYARQFDITFEIVVVLDNADAATASLAQAYDYSVFDASQVIRVRNGSLGLSRNDGIAASHGEFITTADGDDLLSFDFLHRMYVKANHVPVDLWFFLSTVSDLEINATFGSFSATISLEIGPFSRGTRMFLV